MDYADKLLTRAAADEAAGRFADAENSYRRTLELQPQNVTALARLGVLAHRSGRQPQAIDLLNRALRLRPGPDICLALADACRSAARYEDAVNVLRYGLKLAPAMPELHNNLGPLLIALGRLDEAEGALTSASKLCPNRPEPPLNLGNLAARRGQQGAALHWFRRAEQLDPKNVSAIMNQAIVLQDVGLVDQAPALFERALALAPRDPVVWDNLLLALTRTARYAPAAVYQAHQEYQKRIAGPLARFQRPHTNDPDRQRPLRIGYLSFDLRMHPVGLFIEPVLAAHDRGGGSVHVTAYSTAPQTDEVTARLRGSVDVWRDVVGMNDPALVEQIRSDRIDILIDLGGHTVGNRLIALAIKPAPIAVTWLGYPNTTGLEAIDYRLTDAHADPPDSGESLGSEKLLRLSPCAWCYRAPPDAPDVSPLPAKTAGHVTFGSFNALAKLSDATVELWSRVLGAVANSRLLLKTRVLSDEPTRRLTLERFARHGVTAERIEMLGGSNSMPEHLASYARVDVALDTFPYHGTTTTCEAMWMGVPVVTLAGKTHASRVGVSLLNAAGLPELIAGDGDAFVRIATEWAGDVARLESTRAGLRERMLASPLCDATNFTRGLEAALRQIWVEWCDQQRPAGSPAPASL
jgi:predicted O-linked N-acetylglucosamine transferase (SPINDLY family)